MRLGIARLTQNRFLGLGFGALATVILQSSTATILMLMGLASTGLLTLSQSFAVILGADIGTTLVVILLSIKKIADYALLLVVFGFVLEDLLKNSKPVSYIGRILFGFGMVFYGMKLMTETASPLGMNPEAQFLFELMANHPVAILLVSIVFTAFVQTSAATIGMAMALGLAGVIALSTAIPIVLGANIGTCFTAILATLTSDTQGKRVALAHLFVKVTGVLLAIPFVFQVAELVHALGEWITSWFPIVKPGVAGEIALVHLIFNIGLALLFLPFIPFGIWIVSKLLPERRVREGFGPKYLDKRALKTPALAFAQAKQELLRIANMTRDLYRDSLKIFERALDATHVLVEMEERDDKIDLLERAVRFYLAKISQETLSEGQAGQEMALISVGDDLEGIGDIISKELGRLAQKKQQKGSVFSEEGWGDIQKLHQAGLENFDLVIAAFASPAEELTRKVLHQGQHFNELEESLRESHIARLHAQKPESFETSSIHLDVLGNFRRINAHLVHIAELALRS